MKGERIAMKHARTIRSLVAFVLLFACMLSVSVTASADKKSTLDSMFYTAADAKGSSSSLAFVTELPDKSYVVYTSSELSKKASNTAKNSVTSESYELSFREDLGSLYSWTVLNPKTRPLTHAMRKSAAPVKGETVQVIYQRTEKNKTAFVSVERKISGLSEEYDDGTATLLLNESVDDYDALPGIVLNSAGRCVGALKDSSLVYTDYYVKSTFNGGASPTASPTPSVTPGYLTDASQISASDRQKICAQMEEKIDANVTQSWAPEEHLLCSNYVGIYVLSLKPGYTGKNNIVLLVYSNDVNIRLKAEGINKNLTYYYVLQYNNVTIDAKGKCSFGAYTTPHSTVRVDRWYYDGYATQNDLYSALVSPNLNKYTVTTVGSVL